MKPRAMWIWRDTKLGKTFVGIVFPVVLKAMAFKGLRVFSQHAQSKVKASAVSVLGNTPVIMGVVTG